MTKNEMIKYLENYIDIYDSMLHDHQENYPDDKVLESFLKTRLDCYIDILNDFTNGGKK